MDKFNLVPSDVLLDLGSGTGTLAQNIKKQAKLKRDVICVEPNEAMVAIARKKEGITVVQATAEEFISQEEINSYCFSKVLIAFCSHHFADSRDVLFSKLSEHLQPGHSCLIIDRHPNTMLPMFDAALQQHKRAHANDLKSEQYSALLQPLGFVVSSCEVVLEYRVTKTLWYKTLRERFISYFHQLTDDQIEDGIRELEMQYQRQEDILIHDPVLIHNIVKCESHYV